MNEAFSRNVKQGAPRGDQIGTACHLSPASETEMDDPGITFVPKKYHNGSPAHPQVHELPNVEAKVDAEGANTCTVSASQPLDHEPSEDQDRTSENQVVSGMRCPPQRSETPKGPGSRQAGTPITETELMRRRRLLDSHIFE